ncbi:MAG: hypothetical protein EOO92_05805 [Pedobacter sp.]|nr:MAG: hypothetical protein EOO92_05805 [Pedobacter sp.]
MNNSLKLKSLTAIILLLVFLNTTVRAQDESIEKQVTFGFSLGANASLIASFNSSSMQGASSGSYYNHPIVSFNGGFTADVKLTKVLLLQTGLLYNGKGGKNDPFINRLHYLEIPLIVAKKFKIGNASFSAGGGGYVGSLLKAMQTCI